MRKLKKRYDKDMIFIRSQGTQCHWITCLIYPPRNSTCDASRIFLQIAMRYSYANQSIVRLTNQMYLRLTNHARWIITSVLYLENDRFATLSSQHWNHARYVQYLCTFTFHTSTRRMPFGISILRKILFILLLQNVSCLLACYRRSLRRTMLETCSALTGWSRNARCSGTAPGRVKPVPLLPSLVSSTRSTPSKLCIIPRQWRQV